MFQFSELLTLAVGLVMLTYLVGHWHRLRRSHTLRPFILPAVLILSAWVFTVLEGVFMPWPPTQGVIVVQQASVSMAEGGGAATQMLNVLEHVACGAAGIALLAVVVRLSRVRLEVRR